MTEPARHKSIAAEIERQLMPTRAHLHTDVARPSVHLTEAQWRSVSNALRSQIGVPAPPTSIDPECTETEFVVISAVRYCLGRPVIAVRPCIAWLRAHWQRFRPDQRAEVVAEVSRHIAAERDPANAQAPSGDADLWCEFVAWAKAPEGGAAGTERLAALARYRLEILTPGPRLYSDRDSQIRALHRRGFVEPDGPIRSDGRRPWSITASGRAALEQREADRPAIDQAAAP